MRNAEDVEPVTSGILHNKNCHAYLSILIDKIPDFTREQLKGLSEPLDEGLERLSQNKDYDPNFAYADLYTLFFSVVEDNIESIFDEKGKALRDEGKEEELQQLDNFIFYIYHNDNQILQNTFKAIQDIPLDHTPVDASIETKIASQLRDTGQRVNLTAETPAQVGSAYGRFTAMISDNFKPQHTTSLATIRAYAYNQSSPVTEYRFGTQGQRHRGQVRVSPLFERWLTVHARKYQGTGITHIYFNNLGRDRTGFEGRKERALTESLDGLEERHPNVAVITLPADKGLMHRSEFKKIDDAHSYQDVYDEFLKIASQDPDAQRTIKDFYISPKIRELLFHDESGRYSKEVEKERLKNLLDVSFKKLGIKPGSDLSSAQRQAVWFHFIKFKLPNFIIDQLNPNSINFSCKDAIDRGGVSSAYYNLMKSFEGDNPLSREEFERALHAAPATVKARGMNYHLKLIWNALDAYLKANYESVKDDPKKSWLIEWRDSTCPHARVEDLLKLRIQQARDELLSAQRQTAQSESSPQFKAIATGLEILARIEQQSDMRVSGKRLLLETVTRTPEIILNPTKQNDENITRYIRLANKLTVKYPTLYVIGGLLKSLAGLILYLPSLGHTKGWIKKGVATAKTGLAGFKGVSRHQQVEEMKKIKAQIQQMEQEGKPQKDEGPKSDDGSLQL